MGWELHAVEVFSSHIRHEARVSEPRLRHGEAVRLQGAAGKS